MEDAAIVRRRQPGAHLSDDVERLVRRQPSDAPQQRGEILAVHVLHRHERTRVPFGDIMDAAHVGMRHLARGARLGSQPGREVRLLAAQELERDRQAERQVVGAVDLAHAAAPQQTDDAVARGEECTRRERAMIDRAAAGRWAPRQVR
jgi:hypothetical protein